MLKRIFLSGLVTACVTTGACGGSSSPSPSAPVATVPPPPPPPPPDAWADVKSAVDASPISDMRLIIGDANGILLAYEKGTLPSDVEFRIASASKLLTGLTLFRLIETNVMTMDDAPQDYIPGWTTDPQDTRSDVTLEQALSFTTGFNATPLTSGCILRALIALETCVLEIHDDGLETTPGSEFHYGPEHMHIAAGMAQRATGLDYVDIFAMEIADPLGLSGTRFETPSESNPRASGGAVSTTDDYAEILRSLLQGSLIIDLDTFVEDRTGNVIFGGRPGNIGDTTGDWHYGLGFWRECDSPVWEQSCEDNIVISSPGAFGWLPWVDFGSDYYGLIAVEESDGGLIGVGDGPTSRSIELEQELQPLIEIALSEIR